MLISNIGSSVLIVAKTVRPKSDRIRWNNWNNGHYDVHKIFPGCQRMAKVPNAVEILLRISTAWVWHTSITDDRHTANRRTSDSL